MSSTATDTAMIIEESGTRFHWGITIAGAIAMAAVTSFLLMLGTGVGLAFVREPVSGGAATAFLSLGAIYFFASQAFGFAVGGYLVGRLIGPEAENTEEEEFRAAAHGFAMWAVASVVGLLIFVAFTTLAESTGAAEARSQTAANSNHDYWVDLMFRSAATSPEVSFDKAEAGRILAFTPITNNEDTIRLARLVAQDTGISALAAMDRVTRIESLKRQASDNVRKSESIFSLWAAFSLLFGAVVATASAISARWMDDRVTFSMSSRR